MIAMLTIIKFQLIAVNCPFRVGRRSDDAGDGQGGHDSVGGLGALMARIIPTGERRRRRFSGAILCRVGEIKGAHLAW